jgi:putative ABC transport system ATP-binding protein
MIELKSVSVTYNEGTVREVRALREIDLSVPAGEFVVVLGSNGSGKSTLLNVLAGSARPATGRVFIDGRDVTGLADYERSAMVARIFQDPLRGTAPDLSVLDNMRLASLRAHGKRFRLGTGAAFRRRAAERLAPLGLHLEEALDREVGTLSGGQRQALTLAMSFLEEPRVLLLDEPAAALDPKTSGLLMATADDLIRRAGVTALWVTHHMHEAVQYGDRVLLLREGRLEKDVRGTERRALRAEDLYRWFG